MYTDPERPVYEPVGTLARHRALMDAREDAAQHNSEHTLRVMTDQGIIAAGRFPRGGDE